MIHRLDICLGKPSKWSSLWHFWFHPNLPRHDYHSPITLPTNTPLLERVQRRFIWLLSRMERLQIGGEVAFLSVKGALWRAWTGWIVRRFIHSRGLKPKGVGLRRGLREFQGCEVKPFTQWVVEMYHWDGGGNTIYKVSGWALETSKHSQLHRNTRK